MDIKEQQKSYDTFIMLTVRGLVLVVVSLAIIAALTL